MVTTKQYVWVVVYDNYVPAEIAEIYDNEEAAAMHANRLSGDWHAECWTVQSVCTQVRQRQP